MLAIEETVTKGVMRIRKSRKDRKYNDQRKMDIRIGNYCVSVYQNQHLLRDTSINSTRFLVGFVFLDL